MPIKDLQSDINPALIRVSTLKWIKALALYSHSVIKPFLIPRKAGCSLEFPSINNILINIQWKTNESS